jgi:hypothetical protein
MRTAKIVMAVVGIALVVAGIIISSVIRIAPLDQIIVVYGMVILMGVPILTLNALLPEDGDDDGGQG